MQRDQSDLSTAHQIRVETILGLAKTITPTELLQTDQILGRLQKAQSPEDVKEIIESLPAKIKTVIFMVKAEFESIKKSIGSYIEGSFRADIEKINAELVARIPATAELISIDVSSKLAVLSEIFNFHSDKLNPGAVNITTEFTNSMKSFAPLVSIKRQETNPDRISISQEKDREIRRLENQEPLNYETCKSEIKKKRRELMQELPEERRMQAETILQEDPTVIRYSKFIAEIDAINKNYQTQVKGQVNRDEDLESKQVQKLRKPIDDKREIEAIAKQKIHTLQEATNVYYQHSLKVVQNALRDHPELGAIMFIDYTGDPSKTSQVPGSVFLAEQMYLVSSGKKGQQGYQKAEETFSSLTHTMTSTIYSTKINPDNADKQRRRAALLALPEKVQSDLLNLQIVNELRNKLSNPSEKSNQEVYEDAISYLSNPERQKVLTSRNDSAAQTFLKCLKSIGFVISGQLSKARGLWKAEGQKLLDKASSEDAPSLKSKK